MTKILTQTKIQLSLNLFGLRLVDFILSEIFSENQLKRRKEENYFEDWHSANANLCASHTLNCRFAERTSSEILLRISISQFDFIHVLLSLHNLNVGARWNKFQIHDVILCKRKKPVVNLTLNLVQSAACSKVKSERNSN